MVAPCNILALHFASGFIECLLNTPTKALIKHVAQLSQRDGTAGWVSFGQKWKTLKCSHGKQHQKRYILRWLRNRVRPIPCRRPILSAASIPILIPIPIPGCTNFLYWKCDFVWGIGVCKLYMYAGYMREKCRKYGIGLKLYACVQQCWLLRQINEQQDYWYRCRYSNKYRPIPIPTNTGEYRSIPDTGIGLTLLRKNGKDDAGVACVDHCQSYM